MIWAAVTPTFNILTSESLSDFALWFGFLARRVELSKVQQSI